MVYKTLTVSNGDPALRKTVFSIESCSWSDFLSKQAIANLTAILTK